MTDEECIKQAEYCRKAAQYAGTEEGKAAWLRLAEQWLSMMRPRPEIIQAGRKTA